MIRLQGVEWHNRKHTLKLVETKTSDNGNIKGVYKDWQGRKIYVHWFNEEEKELFLKEGNNV